MASGLGESLAKEEGSFEKASSWQVSMCDWVGGMCIVVVRLL